ncbi:helix-turn-helix domain-containing protein [Actinacidiphila oryziradicis]|uniref:Helix-turn-helix domain-containing protein n=1 Tax=Actinacidiphila oryziradicis TaxID=2571141 RepID=A0A4U0STH8_9ACTN|nr:helix-turn-helix transcriptional regulator [Actinacidiphila oryziradicis]TKA11751.1 helix-turn-helix domain-containing protein [Actinacidiphila oryziradicis]
MPAEIRMPRTPPPELGVMLGAARMRAGYRLREAARLAGIGHEYLLRLETGQRTPSRSVATVLADVLELDDAERAELLALALADAGRDHPDRRVPGSPIGNRAGVHRHHPD